MCISVGVGARRGERGHSMPGVLCKVFLLGEIPVHTSKNTTLGPLTLQLDMATCFVFLN